MLIKKQSIRIYDIHYTLYTLRDDMKENYSDRLKIENSHTKTFATDCTSIHGIGSRKLTATFVLFISSGE